MSVRIIQGDCREVLKGLPEESVHCVVTSPPYFQLRDYQVAGQIGLEATPDAYVAELVSVFREVRRVLRADGTLWLNLGDSYAGSWGAQSREHADKHAPNVSALSANQVKAASRRQSNTGSVPNVSDILARDLKGGVLLFGRAHPRCGAPERVHILVDDQAAPDGVFQPFLRAQRITVQQGQHHLCEIGNTFDAPVTCWARRPLGTALPDDADAERGMYIGENVRIILAAGDLHTDSALRSAIAHAVKNGKAAFAVEVAGEPEAEGVTCSVAVRNAFTIHADAIGTPDVDTINEPVALLDRANGRTSGGGNLSVGNATGEHVALVLHGGRELRVASVGHLSLLKDGGLTSYMRLLDKATRNANTLLPKQELGIPEMVKRALMEDGWICRQTIIWQKPNPMPESVRDRCTKAHEYIFLLSKSARYYYDAEAIAEPVAPSSIDRLAQDIKNQTGSYRVPGKTNGTMKAVGNSETRNRRSVWTVATQPFFEAHFATFPPALIEPCIKAGCPEGGTVLDPFGGAGTSGLVADRLGRDAILIELNADYVAMAARRIHDDAPLLAHATATQTAREAAE